MLSKIKQQLDEIFAAVVVMPVTNETNSLCGLIDSAIELINTAEEEFVVTRSEQQCAQRTAAISHLREMGKLCLQGGIMGEYQFYRMAIQQAIAAYQAVGILKPDKE